MLLDAETFDLVQHIDTVLAAREGDELEAAHQPGADAVGARDHDARLPAPPPTSTRELRKLRALRHRGRRDQRACASARPARTRSASSSASGSPRATATAPRRPAAVRRPARADLRHAHPRRGRRRREGDPGRERPARPPPAAARALRQLARSGAASRPASRRAGRWSSPRSHARGRRRASATTPTTRRSSASSSGPAASPTTRTSGGTSGCTRASARRDPDLRRGHAGRGRGRDRRVLPGARQALLRAATTPARRSPRTTGS